MQKLRILFYGDDRVSDDGFGVSKLTKFVTEGLKKAIDVEVRFVHRHRAPGIKKPVQGANKLAWHFLDNYDELWIFGTKQANLASEKVMKAEPYNELDEYEKAVLLEWMKTKGVMVTGDHSEPLPIIDIADLCTQDHSKFVTLGAAIGRHVPRAHQLRVWHGPPTRCAAPLYDNQNTVDGPDLTKLDTDEDLQFDAIPQKVVRPSSAHKLFSWVNPAGQVVPITVFPDHQHEGKVVAPTAQELDHDWPTVALPPEIVAFGNDKRPFTNGKEYGLVVAFDGDPVVGRIVADSSFHHYVDPNLDKLKDDDANGNPMPGTDLDQMAQYYCNLALWLAPKSIRDQLRIDLLSRLAIHPLVLDTRGMGVERLGRATRKAAELEVGSANLYRILGISSKDGSYVNDLISTAFSPSATSAFALESPELPTTDTVLGSIVQEFHDYFSAQGIFSPGYDETVPASAIVDSGFLRAFQQTVTNLLTVEEDEMGKCVEGEVWISKRRGTPDGTFTITQIDNQGLFTGIHKQQDPNREDPIRGQCKDNHISYVREGAERLWYSGDFTTEDRIDGVISPLPLVTKRLLLPVDDDWVGTHT